MRQKLAFADDRFHDECGVFGVFGHPEASNLAYLGLYALQHRGQESAGIVSSDGKELAQASYRADTSDWTTICPLYSMRRELSRVTLPIS